MAPRAAFLVWSPGFGTRLLISAAVEITLVVLCLQVPTLYAAAEDVVAAVQTALLDGAHALKWWSAIAMLASACCVVQIILSALSVGCSGLNALLGPLRPPLIVATLLLQTGSWWVVLTKKPAQARSVALSSAVALLLAMSPEVFDLARNRRRRGASNQGTSAGDARVLRISKMSCAVCEAKVRETAESLPGVLRCDVDIDRSECNLFFELGADADATTTKVVRALTHAGHPLASTGNDVEPQPPSDGQCATAACPRASAVDAGAAATGCGAESCADAGARRDGLLGGVLGGLLGSSCCAVQLALNGLASLGLGLSAGCAGFNTVLGPLRPYTRAATATFLCVCWARSRPSERRALVLTCLLTAALTYLPEMLLYTGATALAPPTDGAVHMRVSVGGMGCEACQHAVAGVLFASSGVLDARVRGTEEDGIAELLVHPAWGFNLSDVARRVGEAGFELDEAAAEAVWRSALESVTAPTSGAM